MNTSFMICLQTLAICNAIFWTFAWFAVGIAFYVKGMKNQDANITIFQNLIVAFSWATFYYLIRIG
jgi:hypothetical protein